MEWEKLFQMIYAAIWCNFFVEDFLRRCIKACLRIAFMHSIVASVAVGASAELTEGFK